MTAVSTVTGADGTPVVPGQTVARDRAIIPGRGVQVDIEGVGAGLLANDTGGAILGYRLDLFNGAGIAACANYSNPIAISACNPEQTGTCPGSGLK
jgi:membrane-bound lytic murein transglycosylase